MLSTGLELLVVHSFIYSTIVGDPVMQAAFAARGKDVANQVWEYRAGSGIGFPIIAYQRTDSADIVGLGGARIMSTVRELIRVVDVGEDWQHEDIARRLDQLFGLTVNRPVADPPGYIEACVRFQPYDMPEDSGGVHYRHLGGVYDFAAQAY